MVEENRLCARPTKITTLQIGMVVHSQKQSNWQRKGRLENESLAAIGHDCKEPKRTPG